MIPPNEFQIFKDRHEAGKLLAKEFRPYERAEDAIVIALPRGGVAVAYDICVALALPLDVLITRKLGMPWNPEAMGAMAETGYVHMNSDVMRQYHVPYRTVLSGFDARAYMRCAE